jgi:hypothetical protein
VEREYTRKPDGITGDSKGKDGMRVDFLTGEFYMEKRGIFQKEDL